MDVVARKTITVDGKPCVFVLLNKWTHRTFDPLYNDLTAAERQAKPKRRHIGYDWEPEYRAWTTELEEALHPESWPTKLAEVKTWADWFSEEYENRV